MANFFEPGHTYVQADPYRAPELMVVFKCIAVAEHPSKHEMRALGFHSTVQADEWASAAYRPGQWDQGWVEVECHDDNA